MSNTQEKKPLPQKVLTTREAVELNGKIVSASHRAFGDPTSILALCEQHSHLFNHVNYATALSALARTAKGVNRNVVLHDERFQALLQSFQQKYVSDEGDQHRLYSIGVRTIASVLHALAKIRSKDKALAQILFQRLDDPDAVAWLMDNGTPQAISNICWAAAKLEIPCPALFRCMESPSSDYLLRQSTPQNISIICWAAAKLGHPCPEFFAKVDAISSNFITAASPQAIANTVWAFGKLNAPGTQLFLALNNPKLFEPDGFLPQHFSNVAWACAVSGRYVPAVFDALEKIFQRQTTSSLAPQVVSNSAWACATLELPLPKSICLALCSDSFTRHASSHELAQAVWATAKSNSNCHALLANVTSNAEIFVSNETSPQAISMILWALAVLDWPSPTLIEQLETRAFSFVEKASPIDRCNVAWACAKLGQPTPRLLAAMEENIVDFEEPRQCANTIWAYARQGVSFPKHWEKLDVDWLLKNGTPHDWACCLWGKATDDPIDATSNTRKLFIALDENVEKVLEGGTEQTISMCAWSCGTMQVYPAKFFDAVLAESTVKDLFSNRFSTQAISNILWACGKLNVQCPHVVEQLRANRASFLVSARPQEVSNSLWALAVLGNRPEELLQDLWNILLDCDATSLNSTESASQVLYFDAVARIEQLPIKPLDEQRRSSLAALLPEESMTTSSSQCRKISQLLTEMGWEHRQEVPPLEDHSNLFSIDLASADTGRLAVEYHGPRHYVRTPLLEETTVNGPTAAKERLLDKMGWKVVSLDWKEERKHKDAKKDWLRAKLASAGQLLAEDDVHPPVQENQTKQSPE